MGVLSKITEEYFGESKRKEDCLVLLPSKREDITIIDEHKLLSTYLLDLLQNGASLDFHLDGYASLANILNTLGVKVRICEGVISYNITQDLDETEAYWKKKLANRTDLLGPILERLEEERKWATTAAPRGRYLPEEKIIELYPEEMKSEPDGKEYLDYLLLTTLVHEAMHAYFDRPGHSSYPYARFVEEPMAEFGMLLFLKETETPGELQTWAHDDVAGKKSCYRFGATLFDQYCGWNKALRDHLEAYKYGISKYEMLDVDGSGKLVALPFPDYEKTSAGHIKSSGSEVVLTPFDFKRNYGVIGVHDPRIITSIASKIVSKKSLKIGDPITITFYDKTGNKVLSADFNVESQNRITMPKEAQDIFIGHYGYEKVPFGFYEKAVGKWVAQELN